MSVLRRHGAFALLLLALAPAYLLWTHSDSIGLLGNDGPSYLMMSQHYASAGGNAVYAAAAAASKYPPLYPLALAALGAATDLFQVHAVTTGFFLLALIALYLWLQLAGLGVGTAAALCLLFALLPGSWMTGLLIQSEYLYLLMSLAALATLAAHQRQGRREWLLLAAICVALATLTRTIGVTLFLPLLWALRRETRGGQLLALSVAAAPVLVWHLLHRAPLGYADELAETYGSQRWQALLQQVADELPALRRGFGNDLFMQPALRPLADLLGVVCLASLMRRAVSGALDSLYCVANLLVLIVWPFPAEAARFLWVLLPILLAQPLLLAVDRWRERPLRAVSAFVALAMVLLVMAVPALARTADRYRAAARSPVPEASRYLLWYIADAANAERFVGMQVAIVNTLSALPSVVPANDCVVATRPDIVSYFGKRYSTYPPPPWEPDGDFLPRLRSTGCHYLFAIIATDPGRRLSPLYPLSRIAGLYEPVLVCPSPEGGVPEGDPVCALVRLKASAAVQAAGAR